MSKALTTRSGVEPPSGELIEKVLLQGDLKALSPEQRLNYYKSVCQSLGLNPLTKPFDYMVLDNKLVLYARKDCTEQLRRIYNISVTINSRERSDDIYTVVAQAKLPGGRVDESMGVVPLIAFKDGKTYPLTAIGMANAYMKAETKAKRRVTLSICGLGIMDESEIEHNGNEFDQRTPSEVAERNVREATANATGSEAKPDGGDPTLIPNRIENGNNSPYGPKIVTQGNYKERIAHIGKADGRIVGRKVGEMEPPVIKWMHEKWRNSLPPSATEDDLALKKAIEFAYKDLGSGGEGGSALGGDAAKGSAPAAHSDVGAKQAAINDLRDRIEKMVLTEAQAIGYLEKFGFPVTGCNKLDDIEEGLLLHLCTPGQWKLFVTLYEKEAKPTVSPTIRTKRGRKKK